MKRVIAGLLLAIVGFLGLLVVQAVLARRGADEPFANPSPEPVGFGERGAPLDYVVIGDSTGAGQGAPYPDGIAVRTARHLAAKGRRVSLVNLSVSGATTAEVVRDQLPAAVRLRPDVVLLASGANDVTGLRSGGSVARDVRRVAGELRAASPGVRIVVTGSPDVGSSPRLGRPLRWVAGLRASQVNDAIEEVVNAEGLGFARIAERTGPQFKADRTLFSADRYHPNARGYATWIAPLTEALDRAG